MQKFCAAKNFFELKLFGRNFLEHHAAIVGVDVFRRKILERVDGRQLRDIFVGVDENRLDYVMFTVAGVAEGENFFVARAVDNFQRVVKCAVERVILRGVDGAGQFAAVAQDEMQAIGLILHDEHEIFNKRDMVGVAALAVMSLRRRAQCVVEFDVVT